jgi:hypothetical protein
MNHQQQINRIICLFILCSSVCSAQSVAFVNGVWFNRSTFSRRKVYAVGGNLTFHQPAHISSTVDLGGGYVVPPFGEAHNHNVEPLKLNKIGPLVERYLRHGIFYVKNPNLPSANAHAIG